MGVKICFYFRKQSEALRFGLQLREHTFRNYNVGVGYLEL